MRRLIVTLILLTASVQWGCNSHSVPTAPSEPVTGSSVRAIYTATLTASTSCAGALPADTRSRTYTASLLADGNIRWSAPTVQQPPGHRQVSSATLSGDLFSFVLGTKVDRQSDAFHGISEELGGGVVLLVSGGGSGMVRDSNISGTFDGLFEVYVAGMGSFCQARDHRFTLERR